MKPSDHPDFFRLPPPEGRSRESTIRLDGEGRFTHDGNPVEHPGMARAFASWIQRHPDDGRFILNNGYDWSYFQVEDVPFFVLGVEERGGELMLALSDGSETPLDAESLRVGRAGALYLPVKNGLFFARFSQTAQLSLGQWLAEGEGGELVLEIAGLRLPLRTAGGPLMIEAPRDESSSSGSAF